MARLSPLMALPPVIFAGFAVMAYLGMYRGDPNALPSTFIGLSEEMAQALVYGSIVLGAILVIVLFFRSRSENRRIAEALENQFED